MPLKFTVALGRKVKPVRFGAVIPTTTCIVTVGLVFLAPPRAAMLHVITLVFTSPGCGVWHVAGLDPVLGVTVTELMVKPLSMVMVKTTSVATVPVLSLALKVRLPDWPGLSEAGVACPLTGTEIVVDPGGGGVPGGVVVRCSSLKTSESPLASKPVTRDDKSICAFCICTTTSMLVDAPPAIFPTE